MPLENTTTIKLQSAETQRFLDIGHLQSCVMISVDEQAAVEEALTTSGYEIIAIDVQDCITGCDKDPIKIAAAALQKLESVIPGINEPSGEFHNSASFFENVFDKIKRCSVDRKFAFIFIVPPGDRIEASDPAYIFLHSALKNGCGFSSRERPTNAIAVVLYSNRLPYGNYSSPFNEGQHFIRG